MRNIRCLLLASCIAFAVPARAEVKDAAAGGFTVENVQTVPVAADAAWQALIEDVDRWWPKDHSWWGEASTLSIDPRAGGCFCELDGARQAQHMQVVFAEPGKTLRMLGGLGPLQGMGLHGVLEFRLTPAEAEGTRIALYYRVGGYTGDDLAKLAPVVDRVQAQQLAALANHLRAAAGGAAPAPPSR